MNQAASRTRGFSLVEVVVALALIGFLIVFVFTVFPSIHKGARLAENHASAAFLGQSLLNQERVRGFASAAGRSGVASLPGTHDGHARQQQMNYQVDVESLDSFRKRVWVTVTWTDDLGARKVVVETLLAATK